MKSKVPSASLTEQSRDFIAYNEWPAISFILHHLNISFMHSLPMTFNYIDEDNTVVGIEFFYIAMTNLSQFLLLRNKKISLLFTNRHVPPASHNH